MASAAIPRRCQQPVTTRSYASGAICHKRPTFLRAGGSLPDSMSRAGSASHLTLPLRAVNSFAAPDHRLMVSCPLSRRNQRLERLIRAPCSIHCPKTAISRSVSRSCLRYAGGIRFTLFVEVIRLAPRSAAPSSACLPSIPDSAAACLSGPESGRDTKVPSDRIRRNVLIDRYHSGRQRRAR